jgi:hypothetical protein
MTQDQMFQEYSDARFGFKVQMPKRFEIIPTTVDPLARLIRGLDDLSEEEQRKTQQNLPVGFWDPEMIGELESGQYQPLRLIEYDALRGGETIPPDQAKKMWDEVIEFMPQTIESAGMPGYKYLGTTETTLGEMPALAFDYRWDGPRPKMYGGDHVRIVWAVNETTMFHVYYHCSTQEWDKRLPEFEQILGTFAVLEPEEMEQEKVRSAAAMAAYSAAQAAGDSEEAAMAAGQAAYEAVMAGEGAGPDAAVGEPAAAAEEPLDMAAAIAEAREALADGAGSSSPAAEGPEDTQADAGDTTVESEGK